MDLPTFTTGLFLEGTWQPGSNGTFTALNPSTAEPLAEIAAANADDVDRAVAAATDALHGDWAAVPPSQKGALLHRLADLVERDATKLAALESVDVGTPFGLAQACSSRT